MVRGTGASTGHGQRAWSPLPVQGTGHGTGHGTPYTALGVRTTGGAPTPRRRVGPLLLFGQDHGQLVRLDLAGVESNRIRTHTVAEDDLAGLLRRRRERHLREVGERD